MSFYLLNKKPFDNIKHVLPAILFIAIVLMDMFQGQWELYTRSELPGIKLLKLVTLVFISAYALKSYRMLLFIIAVLTSSVAIGYNKSLFQIDVLQHLVKYISPFIYYYGFKVLLNSKEKRRISIKVGVYLIYFSLIAIIAGVAFEIESFQTYTNRFGYKGLFKRSIDVSYFLIFSILYISVFKSHIRRTKVLLALVFLCIFIVGTKLPWMFLALYLGYLFVKNKRLRKPILLYAIPLGLVSAGFLYFIFPDKVMGTFNLFYKIYLEKGFISSLTSFRSDLLVEAIAYYKNHWQWHNILFGGQDFNTVLVEMSLPDLIIFFGFIGAMLYSIIYYNVYFRNKDKNFQILYAMVIIASIFAGQFFFNPSVTIWFAVLAVLANNERESDIMRIFLISNMYPSKKNKSYGVFVQNTVQALEQSGVLFSKKSVLKGRSSGKAIKLLRYVRYYFGVVFYYLFGDFDIIYIHFLSHNTPVLYFILKLFGKKKQWVINVHGSDVVKSEGRKIDQYNYLILQRSDLIIVPSKPFVERMRNQYPNLEVSKFYVSPSGGINPSVFYPSETQQKQKKKFIIGFASRIDEGKGWNVFLDAIHLLKEANIAFQAIIAGGGSEVGKLKNHIARLNLENQVTYLGNLTQKELGEAYRSLDLFVFSTVLEESLGLVAIEAMACGVPVVGSAIPGIKSYLNHEENGFCFNPGDPKDLAHYVKRYVNLSEEDKSTMREMAVITAKHYNSQEVNKRLFNKFKTIYNLES